MSWPAGTKRWRDAEGRLHRDDGPALEFADGSKYWFVHGQRHRLEGPAVDLSDGTRAWFLDDRLVREERP